MDLLQVHLWMSDLIYRAGDKIRKAMQNDLKIAEKSNFRDLVTNVDKQVEEFFIQQIRQKFPEHQIMGEESEHNQFSSLEGYVWIIDPIDGTMNFIKQQDKFGILISLFRDGIGQLGYIYDVMNDKMCFAIKDYGAYLNGQKMKSAENQGIKEALFSIGDCVARNDSPQARKLLKESLGFREIGSAALAEMAVFEKKLGAYVNFRLSPWDFSPAIIIAQELGYLCQDIEGNSLDLLSKTTFVLGNPQIVTEIKEVLKGIAPPY